MATVACDRPRARSCSATTRAVSSADCAVSSSVGIQGRETSCCQLSTGAPTANASPGSPRRRPTAGR